MQFEGLDPRLGDIFGKRIQIEELNVWELGHGRLGPLEPDAA